MKNKIKKSNYIKNIAILATGSGISQLIIIIVSPILTRIYSVENFGTIAFFMSISSILIVFSSAKYEMAILQAKYHFEALSLTIGTMLMSSLFSILLFFLYISVSDNSQVVKLNNNLGGAILFIPMYVLMSSFINILSNYINRLGLYKVISLNHILTSITKSAAKLLLSLVVLTYNGLIVGALIGVAASFCYMIYRYLITIKSKRFFLIAYKSILKCFYKHRKFPKFTLPSDGFNAVAAQVPIFLTAYFFSTKDIGYLAFAFSMVSLPLGVIGGSISRVFKTHAANEYNSNGHCHVFVKKNIIQLLFYLSPPFFVLIFIAPFAFKFIFGEHWVVSGEIVQVLVPMFFLQFIARIVNFIYPLSGRQKQMLWIQVVIFISSLFAFFLGALLFNDFMSAIVFYSIFYSIIYFLTIVKSYEYSKG
jgi:O-antigen/teichoic acid export membrane protein